MVGVEYDEFGAGRADRIHAQLFADLMTALGLDPAYGAHPYRAPAALLANVARPAPYTNRPYATRSSADYSRRARAGGGRHLRVRGTAVPLSSVSASTII
ncbi:iron-containing redox enzyme family protein [Streptomyces sp. NBC_01006]|nr:iron-containing redox enzyme family protein [Streptomyces sp. NBC_01006]